MTIEELTRKVQELERRLQDLERRYHNHVGTIPPRVTDIRIKE